MTTPSGRAVVQMADGSRRPIKPLPRRLVICTGLTPGNLDLPTTPTSPTLFDHDVFSPPSTPAPSTPATTPPSSPVPGQQAAPTAPGLPVFPGWPEFFHEVIDGTRREYVLLWHYVRPGHYHPRYELYRVTPDSGAESRELDASDDGEDRAPDWGAPARATAITETNLNAEAAPALVVVDDEEAYFADDEM